MSLKSRRILFIIFILSFFIISGLVLTYASGYKITFNGKRPLQKTGMLILDSNPPGAKIYINNQPQKLFINKILNKNENFITTPSKIKNLLPGEYNIKLELSGYWIWEKKLEIKGGVSTFAEDINLFKKDLPILLKETKSQPVISTDTKYIIFSSNSNTFVYDTGNEENYSINNNNSSSTNYIKWSPSGEKFILNDKIYKLGEENPQIDLTKFIKNKILIFRWGNNDDEILFIEKNRENYLIYNFNLLSKNISYLFTEYNINDLIVKDDNLYLLKQSPKFTSLNIYNSSFALIKTIDLPLSPDFEFKNSQKKLIEIYDKKHQILYLINPTAYFPIEEIINNIKYFSWVNNDKLIYGNDFEIWLDDLLFKNKLLLTRLSSEINGILWHPSSNYIIYSSNNTLYSIELDDREKRNTVKLIELPKISDIHLNKQGDTLYFYSEIGSQKGLFKMAIQ